MRESDRDLEAIEKLANRAVARSPWDYNNHQLMASYLEARGDRAAAEQALRTATWLAPNNTNLRWRLANLLLRQGKFADALYEFRLANSSSRNLLAPSLDAIWRVSGGSTAAVEFITGPDPGARLQLAHFLIKQSRVAESAAVFESLDRGAQSRTPEGPAFLFELIAKGEFERARDIWIKLVGAGDPSNSEEDVLAAESFESDYPAEFSHFGWQFGRSEYARFRIDEEAAAGRRSLRIDFAGRDTTRLDSEARQLIPVQSGSECRLELSVKTDGLVTPEGPKIVVTDHRTGMVLAESSPIPEGSSDWKRMTLEFAPGQETRAVFVSIRRIPRFSYDEPTRGTVWLDDLILRKLKNRK
jgi:hypothetical protein